MGVSVVLSGLAISVLLETADGWRIAFALSALLALAVAFSFAPVHGQPAKQTVDPSSQGVDFVTRQLSTKHWMYLILGYLMFGIAYVAYSTFAGTQMAAMKTPILVVGLTWVGFGCAAILGAALTVPIVASSRLKQFALAASLGPVRWGHGSPEWAHRSQRSSGLCWWDWVLQPRRRSSVPVPAIAAAWPITRRCSAWQRPRSASDN